MFAHCWLCNLKGWMIMKTLCFKWNKSAAFWLAQNKHRWGERGGWFIANYVRGILIGCLLLKYWQCNTHSLASKQKSDILGLVLCSTYHIKILHKFLCGFVLLKLVNHLSRVFPSLSTSSRTNVDWTFTFGWKLFPILALSAALLRGFHL